MTQKRKNTICIKKKSNSNPPPAAIFFFSRNEDRNVKFALIQVLVLSLSQQCGGCFSLRGNTCCSLRRAAGLPRGGAQRDTDIINVMEIQVRLEPAQVFRRRGCF